MLVVIYNYTTMHGHANFNSFIVEGAPCFGLFASNHQARAINTYTRKRTYNQHTVNYNS